jgi:sugar phosphate isomerase/epimerase
MHLKTLLICVAVSFVLSLASWSRMIAQDRDNAADGILPGGNILSCETYSLRDLFREQRPDPKRPWVGKYPQLTIYTFPAFMKQLGIKGVAINDGYIGSLEESNLDRIKAACKASDRVITALITGGPMALADEAKRLEGLKAVEQKMRVAKYLGAPVVRIDLGGPGKGISEAIGVENCIDSFKRLLPLAKELNIKMTIENHGGVSKSSEYILKIIKGSDPQWVGSCLDFMNWPHSSGQTDLLYRSCEALAPYAYHTHAKCLTFKDDGEEATVDYGKLLGYLKAAKYKGAISMEFEGPGDPVEGVKKSRDLIIKHWSSDKPAASFDPVRQFEHIGIFTAEKKPNERFVAATKVWVTDFQRHPYGVEWLRTDGPFRGPNPHIAFRVANIEQAAAAATGLKSVSKPFDAGIARVAFYHSTDGAVVEFMEYHKEYATETPRQLPFDHIGLITTEKKPNETYVAATKVWVTGISSHPYRVEWLRFEPDSPVKGPVRDKPHVAFRVGSIAEAAKGLKVLIEPFDAGIAKVGFYQTDDGAVVEFMEYYKKS